MCNERETPNIPSKTRDELIDEALQKMIALKQDIDLELVSMPADQLAEREIEVQLQACCNEWFQCIQAIKKGFKNWSEVPLNVASI